MAALAKQIALPHETMPTRFPSFPALERTAVMGFTQPLTTNLSGTGAQKFMLARQAAYPLWGPNPLLTGGASGVSTYGMGYTYFQGAGVLTDTIPFDGMAPTVLYTGPFTVPGACSPTIEIPGPRSADLRYPVLGFDPGASSTPFIYVPANSSYVVTVGCDGTNPGQASVNFREWISPGETRLRSAVTANPGGGIINIITYNNVSTAAWLQIESIVFNAAINIATIGTCRISFTVGVGAATSGFTFATRTIGFASATVGAMVPLTYPGEFVNSVLPWQSARVTAVSCLFTNVTQVLNKSGTVLAGRVAPTVANPWLLNETYVAGLHPAEKAYLPLETGLYTYTPPSTDMSSFYDYVILTDNNVAAPVYRLDNDAMVNFMFFTPAGVSEALAVTLDWHIEFRSSSTLFQVGMSTATLEAFHQAQLALCGAGYFFENATHKSIIGRLLQSLGKMMSIPSKSRGKGDLLLSSKPKSSPSTTSAKTAGMMPGSKKKKPRAKKTKTKQKKKQ